MSWLTRSLEGVMSVLGSYFNSRHTDQLRRFLTDPIGDSDDQFREACRRASQADLAVEKTTHKRSHAGLWHRLAVSLVRGVGVQAEVHEADLRNLALGIAAFEHAPADLPDGSYLFPEQMHAAVALLTSQVLQMDTGEGKTYALLPAAFALACKHGQAYILCANDYLAWRDANRTRRYWDYVSMSVGLGLEGQEPSEWSKQVIYTTAAGLAFKSLNDDLRHTPPENPITYGAVLIDDADAILLDEANESYAIAQHIASNKFDWARIIELARQLDEAAHITANHADLSATLTIEGEQWLRGRMQPNGADDFLLLRHLVELSFVAIRMAERDKDYVVEGNRIHALDRVTGYVLRGREHNWLIPLEFHHGLRARQKTVFVHNISTSVLLKQFHHIAGLSGTTSEDILEFLFRYHLMTVVIPRINPRHAGLIPDRVYCTRKAALAALEEAVLEAAQKRQPIMIGTQNIEDAEAIRALLSGKVPRGSSLRLLTGKNDEEMSSVFDRAGEPGSILIATQLAGRGIDIRLDDATRALGGILLIGFGRAIERRHELQFLGRAGRHGDPFTAFFICSLEDPLFKMFSGEWVKSVLQSMGMDDNQAIESPMVSRRIRAAQKQTRSLRIIRDFGQIYIDEVNELVRASIRNWLQYQQIECAEEAERCAPVFIDFAIDHFLDEMLGGGFAGLKQVSRPEAERVQKAAAILGVAKPVFRAHDIEGHDGPAARLVMHKRIRAEIDLAMAANLSACKAIRAQQSRWYDQKSAVRSLTGRLRQLREAITRLEHPPESDEPAPGTSEATSSANGEGLVNANVTGVLQIATEEATSSANGETGAGLDELSATAHGPAARDTTSNHVRDEGAAGIGTPPSPAAEAARSDATSGDNGASAGREEDVSATSKAMAIIPPARDIRGTTGLMRSTRPSLLPGYGRTHSESGKWLMALREELRNQNEYLQEHARAQEEVALRKVREACRRPESDELFSVVMADRQMQLVAQIPAVLEVPASRLTQKGGADEPDGAQAAIDQIDWSLLIVELLLTGELAIRPASADPADGAHSQQLVAWPDGGRLARELLDRVEKALEDLRDQLDYAAEEIQSTWSERTPRAIANWTIKRASAEFQDERDRVWHKASQADGVRLEYYRNVYDGVLHAWKKIDAGLSGKLLRHLLTGARLQELDQLFWLKDHEESPADLGEKRLLPWTASEMEPARPDEEDAPLRLVNQFILRSLEDAERQKMNEAELRRLFLDFVRATPLASLHGPERIQQALESWFRLERERGLSTARAKLHLQWLRRFLLFLRERHLVGKLPTFQTWCWTFLERVKTSLSESSTTLFLAPVGAFAFLFILASHYGTWGAAAHWEGTLGSWGQLLFGDLLERGSVATPAVGGLLLGSAVAYLLPSRPSDCSPGSALTASSRLRSSSSWSSMSHRGPAMPIGSRACCTQSAFSWS